MLDAERGGGEFGKDEADEDGLAAKIFLIVELAASILKVAAGILEGSN